MATKKDYINLIRWSCIIDSLNNHYFIRIIVLYLLSQNVTPWVAVSIPIVLEFARLLSRGIKPLAKFALKVDYKKYISFNSISSIRTNNLSMQKCLYNIHIYINFRYTIWNKVFNYNKDEYAK